MITRKFKDVKPGEEFIWQDVMYTKLDRREWKNRYGFINCIGPAFYEGDKGYRHVYDNEDVTQEEIEE